MKKIFASIAVFAPTIVFAQALAPITNVNSLSSRIIGIGNLFTYLLVALAVIYIVWNVVQYVVGGSDPDAKKTAGWNILWGVVGLFVIVSIWGLVNILTNTFKTTPTNQAIPNLGNNTSSGGIPANQIPIVQ